MPGVDVTYREGVGMTPTVANVIKHNVRRFGATNFSVAELSLSEDDFSFKFYPDTQFDTLTNDIIVRVRLHDFPARRDFVDDEMCTGLAELITQGFDSSKLYAGRFISVGVELMLAEVCWGTSLTTLSNYLDSARFSARRVRRPDGDSRDFTPVQ